MTSYDLIRTWIAQDSRLGIYAEYFTVSGKRIRTVDLRYDLTMTYKGETFPFVSQARFVDELAAGRATVMRVSEPEAMPPDHVVAALQAVPGDVLAVGDGAILYRDVIHEVGSRVEFAPASAAHPDAASLVELAVPRLLREEYDRLHEVVPMYLRKSDAEIAADRRSG